MRTWLNATLIAGLLVGSIVAQQENSGINKSSWDVVSSAQDFWSKINGTEWTRKVSGSIQEHGEAMVDSVRMMVQSEAMKEMRKKVADNLNQWQDKIRNINYTEWRDSMAKRVNVTEWSNKIKTPQVPQWMNELGKSVVNTTEWLRKIRSRSDI